VAWAPDATQIAVLGQSRGNCDTFSSVVALFDARGNFERTLPLDGLVLGANGLPTPAPGATGALFDQVQYFAVSWSPDGHEIAIPYQITRTLPNQPIGWTAEGIALLNADGSSGRVLRQSVIGETSVWDLQTLQQVSQMPYTPPPALAFTWSSTGEVTPTQSSDSLGPVGNPSGDARFTIWQPGSISADYRVGSLFFQTMVTAWSPGGHYLTSSLLLAYAFSTSGPNLQPAANNGGISTMRYRDAAMRAVALGLKGPRNTNIPSAPLAWRPDGRQLAALVFNQTSFDGPLRQQPTTAELLAIYDSASGNVLARLPTANLRMAPNSNTSALLLRWSPDGQRVLLVDGAYGLLTIWGPQQLP
ncbi:MAG: hypothetical protein IVW57_18275, partial [Ktedonobacterales bacterium]|nr:hypothetical protein [Ktedonobacterales bacterium]